MNTPRRRASDEFTEEEIAELKRLAQVRPLVKGIVVAVASLTGIVSGCIAIYRELMNR